MSEKLFFITLLIFGWLTNEVQSQSNGDLRLSLGYEGLLEIYYNGTWGYVCSDGWGDKDSSVACRNLGFGKVKTFQINYPHPNQTNEEFKINDVNCTGSENNLINCDYSYTVTYCDYNKHIYLDCNTVFSEGTIRLASDDGRFLQTYINSEWIFICTSAHYYHYFDNSDLEDFLSLAMGIACRELGYSKVKSFQLSHHYYSGPKFVILGFCPRNTSKLSDCISDDSHYCFSRISLRCETETCATSLQFYSTSNSYRLAQTYVDKSWFYICPDSFTKSDADVICRNSGLPGSISFGHVSLENLTQVHPISPISYACSGNESSLCSCPSDTSTCNSSTAVHILCHEPKKGSLRFIRRYYENVLLVAVYSGEWKLVCDLPLNSLGADIICRSAGFRRAESFHLPLFEIYYSYYGHILSNVNAVNDVNCFGNETSLLDCSYREHTGCYVGSIVTCEEDGCESLLRNPESLEAVQIYIGQWYYMCQDNFTQQTADIICRENHDSNASNYTFLPIQPSNYPIYPFYFQCDGNENSICACEKIPQQCSSNRIVHVQCRKQSNGSLKLSKGTSGILEVYLNGWKRVCSFDYEDISHEVADFACRYLGYRNAVVFNFIYIGSTTTSIFPNPRCLGNETNILECVYDLASTCRYESYISCRTEGCQSYIFGENTSEQPVKMYMNENWYYLCSNSISTKEADVICRENRFLNGAESISSIHHSQLETSYEIYPYNITCNGNESSLCDCSMMQMQCTEGNIAEIRCSQPDQGTLRYSNQYPNMLEIYINGGWSHICQYHWDNADSSVACRQLGYTSYILYSYTSATYITTSYPINFNNVICDGTESSLIDCSYSNASCQALNIFYMYTSPKVLLYCTGGDCDVFAPYATQSYQIVEYFINQQRYYLCADGFTAENADVVCRDTTNALSIEHRAVSVLNLPPNTQIYPLQHSCLGSEASLCKCPTFLQSCSSGSSVEVKCGTPDQGTLRYSSFYRDVLEIYYNGGWSYICPDSWSDTDSTVACRQLGFTRYHSYDYYFSSTRKNATSFPNNVHVSCIGSESSIIDCSFTNNSCYSYTGSFYYNADYLSLYCTGGDCEVHAPFATERFQIVEYFVNQQRYYLCADGFTAENADVVCRETSYTQSITVRSVSLSELPLNTQIYPLQHFCFGNESSICNCTTSQQSCQNGSVVEVQCGTPEQGQIRLTLQNKPLFYYNQWRDICSRRWDTGDSDVACRQLGYRNAFSPTFIYDSDYFYNRNDFVTDFACFGNETQLSECRYHLASHCNNHYLITLTCQPDGCESYAPNAASFPQIVRYYSGGWYHLCMDGFTQENADVVCRENEGSTALSYSNVSNSDLTSGLQILERRFICTGMETSLCDCSSSIESCPSNNVVQLQCNTPAYGHIRLANKDSGVLEIYLNQWGYVCDDGWNRIASEVVCKQLGLDSLISYETGVEVNNLLYPFLLVNVDCIGNESTIFECTHTLRHDCSSGEHVSITCGSVETMTTPTTTTATTSTATTTTLTNTSSSTPSTTTTTILTNTSSSTPSTTTTTILTNTSSSTPSTTTTTILTNTSSSTPSTTTLTTSTTTVPTASTTTSTSNFITTSSSIEITPKITSPGMNITKTLNRIDTDIPSIECTATGDPTPDIYWSRDLTTKFIDSTMLQINITDLSTNRVFYCVAENSAGRDVVSVTFKIELTKEQITSALDGIMDELDEVEFISDDKSGKTADLIKVVIDASNDNAEIDDKEKNKIFKNAATIAQTIVEKTNGTFSNETTEKITDLLSSIVSGSSVLQESESTVLQGEESAVATVSSALAITLNTLERFSQRLSEELANSELNSVKTVVSQLITIVVQNVELESREDGGTQTEIELPVKNYDDVEYSVMMTLSTNLAVILSIDGKSLAIATSIVKRIEVEESDSSQPTQGSDILTIALAGKSEIVELTENAKFSFDVYSNQPSESTCVFLNGTSWVIDGLSTEQRSANLTNCESSHLTSFAVFVTPRTLGPDNRIASIVSYVVVSISFIFLIVSLFLFILSGKKFFKVEANIVYFNYCLSLTLAFGLFLFGIETGKFNEILCKIIAFLLHYLWLSVFVWTLCNGILIIYKLTSGMSQHKIYPYLIVFGWTFPIVIPIITVAIKHGNYVNTTQHCFLTYEDGIIWAFIAPIIAIILANMIILVISVIRISTTNFDSEKLKEKQVIKTALVSTLILTPLLGIPWIILLLNIFIVDPIVQWSFIITNGLMGIFFFFVITMRNAEVKKLLKKKKGEYSLMSESTENKSSDLLSKKFKSSVSRDTTDTLSPSQREASRKGNYFPLEPMGTSDVQDDGGAIQSPNIHDMLAPKDAEKDSFGSEIPEESSFSGFEHPSDAARKITDKSAEVDGKVYM